MAAQFGQTVPKCIQRSGKAGLVLMRNGATQGDLTSAAGIDRLAAQMLP